VLGLALLALAAGAGAPSTDGAYAGRTTEGGIGTGDPCSSPSIDFTARRPAAGE